MKTEKKKTKKKKKRIKHIYLCIYAYVLTFAAIYWLLCHLKVIKMLPDSK